MPLTKEDVDFLIKRNDKLKEIRAMYEPLWEEIANFILPRRSGIGYKASPGIKQTTNIYDSTAIHSNELLAASMHGTLTPSSSKWFSLKLRDDRLNRIKEVVDWLEYCADIMYLVFHQSNFDSEIHEVYLDLGAFGQGCLFVEENEFKKFGFNGLRFKSYTNAEYCTQENANGIVDTLFREFELPIRVAIQKWGEKALGKLAEKYKKDPDENCKFLHIIMPSDDEFSSTKPFVSYYIALEERHFVGENGYYEFPCMVPRWSKSSGEEYGRGPGHTALPDVRTLNKAKELDLDSWAIDIFPPTFEREYGVIGNLRLQPRARNVAKDKDALWTLDRNVRYDVSQIKEESLRTSIRQIFFSDQLKLQEGPEMTATEVQVRYELMQRLLGPTIGRLQNELLNPLIERVFGILLRAGALPKPPPIFARMGIREIDIEYEGPLAKAQRLQELTATQRLYTLAGGIAQTKQDVSVMDIIDDDGIIRHAAEVLGVPSKLLRSEREVRVRREQRAELLRQEKIKQELMGIAEGAGAAAPALKILSEMSAGEEKATA